MRRFRCLASDGDARPESARDRGVAGLTDTGRARFDLASEPTPEPVVVQQAATATAVPPVQPAVQPAVSTARPPTPGPPSLPAVAILEAPLRPPPVTVSMTLNLADRSFSPHQVHGNAGDTVALTFTGGTEQHTFTVSSLSIDVTIGARETKQFSFVMPVEGEVPFFCRLHGSRPPACTAS